MGDVFQSNSYEDNNSSDGPWPEYANPAYVMPEEIEVHVSTISGDYSFPVSIIKKQQVKPYFGGYRNTTSSKIYHHASTQTPTELKTSQKENNTLRTRNTQTYEYRTISVQPVREHGTQMQKVDLYLDDSNDIIIKPKIYFTSAELLIKKKQKALEIQRIWRGYMARSKADRLRKNIRDYEQQNELQM